MLLITKKFFREIIIYYERTDIELSNAVCILIIEQQLHGFLSISVSVYIHTRHKTVADPEALETRGIACSKAENLIYCLIGVSKVFDSKSDPSRHRRC